jgi:transposase-like protein
MSKLNVNIHLRPKRIFSDDLKKKIVKDIEKGKISVLKASRELNVSYQAVYSWLKKFSPILYPNTTIVVQMESEQYKSKELEKRIAELEAALGRKQLEIDFLNKMIEIADKDLGIDIKKNIVTPVSSGSNKTKGQNDSD